MKKKKIVEVTTESEVVRSISKLSHYRISTRTDNDHQLFF